MQFCSKCGTKLKPSDIFCTKCNCMVGDLIEVLCKIIRKEREEAIKEAGKDCVNATVITIGDGTITLECDFPKFEEGDIVGYKRKGLINYLGYVISGGKVITLITRYIVDINEGDKVTLCEYEQLLSYDLQLELLESIKNSNAASNVREAVKWFKLEKPDKDLKFSEPSNNNDIKDNSRLNDSQLDAVRASLGLESNDILLIVGPPGTGKTRVIAKVAYELASKGICGERGN